MGEQRTMSDVNLVEAYAALEVPIGAPKEQVRLAYKDLLKVWHPDRHVNDPGLQRRAEERLKRIIGAYELIEQAGFPPAPRERPTPPAQPSSSPRPRPPTREPTARASQSDAPPPRRPPPPPPPPPRPPPAPPPQAEAQAANAGTDQRQAAMGQDDATPNTALRVIVAVVVIIIVVAIRQQYRSSNRSDSSDSSSYQPTYSSSNSSSHYDTSPHSRNTPTSPPAELTPSVSPDPIPDVPPLQAGEVPPVDVPNYFDPREFGSGTAAVYASCVETISKAAAEVEATVRGAYCLCLSDAARSNVRGGRTPIPTDAQQEKCVTYAKHPSGTSPYARGLPKPTSNIIAVLMSCLDQVPADTSRTYGARVCSCTIDATLKNGTASSRDIDRCSIAARYSERTGINLTRRQFAALRATSTR